ncbi:MAG: hypothetical protein HWD60_17655 [Defluviicoccus sp.]|nr:MAG: hypothetical protein HWD60_17655 [Defluviicoccus sp.]
MKPGTVPDGGSPRPLCGLAMTAGTDVSSLRGLRSVRCARPRVLLGVFPYVPSGMRETLAPRAFDGWQVGGFGEQKEAACGLTKGSEPD